MSGDVRRGSPSGPKAMQKVQVGLAAGTLTSQTTKVVTFTCTGARTMDRIVVNSNAALPTNVAIGGARISAANVVSLSLVNPTAADIAGGNMTIDCVLLQFSA